MYFLSSWLGRHDGVVQVIVLRSVAKAIHVTVD